LKTGEQKFRERIGGNFFSSPILADGKIICGSLDGELVMVAASDEFEILGRSRLQGGMHATPAVANGCLFLRTENHLVCVCGK
jgi:outer membrane protein assembly factor BamB